MIAFDLLCLLIYPESLPGAMYEYTIYDYIQWLTKFTGLIWGFSESWLRNVVFCEVPFLIPIAWKRTAEFLHETWEMRK